MKQFLFSIILLLAFSCEKEDCYIISEKRVIDGKYYFYFDARESYELNRGNNSGQGSGYPDRFASGQVNKETYDSVNVGDNYCD